MAEIDGDSDPRRRPRKRTINPSWDSDDELLQDDLQIKKNKGEQSDDDLDEAALLGLSDSEDNAWNEENATAEDVNLEFPQEENGTSLIDEVVYNEEEEFITNLGEYDQTCEEGAEVYADDSLNSSKDHTVPRQSADDTFDSVLSDLGPADILDIDITNEIDDEFDQDLDATTESNFEGETEAETETEHNYEESEQENIHTEENIQESESLNKVDIKEVEQVEENLDQAIKSESSESEEEEEDEQEESGRGRFKSERQPSVVSLASVRPKRDIPETLEISKEAKEKLDEFNRQKEEERQSKRNRRGGRGGRGGPPQRHGYSQRGGYTPYGGNSPRGGFSQHGGPPQRGNNFQRGGPDQHGRYQSHMRFPSRPGQSGPRPVTVLMGNQPIRVQHAQQGNLPIGMNPMMFGQQERPQIRPQIHQQQQRPLLMQRPQLVARPQLTQQQPRTHQHPPRERCPQPLPNQPPSSMGSLQKSEPQQPNKIHINPHFKGAVQVSSPGPTWNNPNHPVSGPVTSSPSIRPRLSNQNRPPDQYNRQQVPPSSSWNQAPRLTPAQTWTTPQSGPHPYRDHQPPAVPSQAFSPPSQNFSPPSHRGPGSSPQMTQSQNSFQPRMAQPQQMQPTIPNRQQQQRPRAAFPHPQQPNYPRQHHQGNYSGPPVQQLNKHQQRTPGPGMNTSSVRPRFPGAPQTASQHYRQPVPHFRQQAPRLKSPVNKSPSDYSLSSSSPRHSSPQRTNQSPTPKSSPRLPAHPQKLIEEASAKSSVQVKQETNEDAETKRLRIQIEEQKKLREEIMKRKEERRQQLAAKRQEALKKRLAEQGHDVVKATKKLGLEPAAAAKPQAQKMNPAPDTTRKNQGGVKTVKAEAQFQEQFLKQKLNQQQQQYQGQSQPQQGFQQPQPMFDGTVKVWRQQQNLKVLVDEPRPIPTLGSRPALMQAPQRSSSTRGQSIRGRGRGRGRGNQHHQNQHRVDPNNANQNHQMYGHHIQAQHAPLQQVPVQQYESPVQQPRGAVPQQRQPMQQPRGGGKPVMRGRGMPMGQGRGRAHQAKRGNVHQQSIGRGQVPVGRGKGQVPVQQAPGNVQGQPAAPRKSVKERLGRIPGAASPQQQDFHQVPCGNQQRVVVPPPQQHIQPFTQQPPQRRVSPRQVLQRPMQPNPMEGARLVKTEPILNRVIIEGLSASTARQKIVHLTESVGPLQNFHLIPNQRKAIVTFHNPQHAYMFQKRYNRHMLDLSMLTVNLIPAT